MEPQYKTPTITQNTALQDISAYPCNSDSNLTHSREKHSKNNHPLSLIRVLQTACVAALTPLAGGARAELNNPSLATKLDHLDTCFPTAFSERFNIDLDTSVDFEKISEETKTEGSEGSQRKSHTFGETLRDTAVNTGLVIAGGLGLITAFVIRDRQQSIDLRRAVQEMDKSHTRGTAPHLVNMALALISASSVPLQTALGAALASELANQLGMEDSNINVRDTMIYAAPLAVFNVLTTLHSFGGLALDIRKEPSAHHANLMQQRLNAAVRVNEYHANSFTRSFQPFFGALYLHAMAGVGRQSTVESAIVTGICALSHTLSVPITHLAFTLCEAMVPKEPHRSNPPLPTGSKEYLEERIDWVFSSAL